MKEMMKKYVSRIRIATMLASSWFGREARRMKEDKTGGLSIVEICLLAVLSMAVIGAAVNWATDGGVADILNAMKDTVIDWITGGG